MLISINKLYLIYSFTYIVCILHIGMSVYIITKV